MLTLCMIRDRDCLNIYAKINISTHRVIFVLPYRDQDQQDQGRREGENSE